MNPTLRAWAAIATAALLAGSAWADAQLAGRKNCLACHQVDRKLVGPAYRDVAARYADDKQAVERLAQKIVKGGAGVWGPVPMPANPQVSEAEARQLAAWVLTLK